MNKLVEKYLSNLKRKNFIELSQLESYQGEKIIQNKKSYTISIWKDMISNNELRIVVQIYRYWLLGVGKMEADGFRINRDGNISDLTKKELYEYI